VEMSPRRNLGYLAAVLLMICAAACGDSHRSSREKDDAGDLEIVSVLPANGLAVSGDLGEAGGRIEIEFSARLREDTVLDADNSINGLSANLSVRDSNLIHARGSVAVDGRRVRFTPPPEGLPDGQYTVTAGWGILDRHGRSLAREFRASFTVGPDVYAPIVLRTIPARNQQDVPRDIVIRITFNEPLDPETVNAQTVWVTDGGVTPAVSINGTLTLENDGFEIVFTPDPWTGLPPGATTVVTLHGGVDGIADEAAGIPFTDHVWYLWIPAGGCGYPVNQFANASCYFSDHENWGVIDASEYVMSPDSPDGGATVDSCSHRFIGIPGEIVLDPRVDANGDTLAYVIDEASSTVAIVDTFNSRILGRLTVTDPRGLAISPDGERLYVTEGSEDTVAVFSLTDAAPGDFALPGRLPDLAVGDGPTGIAHAPDSPYLFVCNTSEESCTVYRTTDDSVVTTWMTGDHPRDVAISHADGASGRIFALVTNSDEDSASLWWSGDPASPTATVGGLNGPLGVTYVDTATTDDEHHLANFRWYVANSRGASVSEIRVTPAGAGFIASVSNTYTTGFGPRNVAFDAVNRIFGFTSNRLNDSVSVFDRRGVSGTQPPVPVPGVRWVATLGSQ
jgi:DNA-binding beta-propeller fold protein YncE